jgi:Asp-tRNA(Asn)/Glu-tRNA(Gln) amidotransferase A subunit family amidase
MTRLLPAVVVSSAISLFLGAFLQSAGVLSPISTERVASAEVVTGLEFTGAERDSMLEALVEQRGYYEALRGVNLSNDVPPALFFDPRVGLSHRRTFAGGSDAPRPQVAWDGTDEDLAFRSVRELGLLLRSGRITSRRLTQVYLGRLKRIGPKLECIVTLTEEIALRQADHADRELAAGTDRGPLHGIPYGLKDLFATRGVRTTWGSVPYRAQMIAMDATVVRRLEEAGAVLLAKLSVGELAWGEVWFGGKTRNPWNLEEGSSGSSAGSAAATSAGLVAFAIGTETWGSIVSPATRCGVTGLRPTFGRVSRHGAMALSWSMDKVGPICRSADDCALVLEVIRGADGMDRSVIDAPFSYAPLATLRGMRVGILQAAFDSAEGNRENDYATLAVLKKLGAELVPVSLPSYPVEPLSIILSAESAASFDELTRSGKDDLMVRQIKNAWPNVFRASRFIPAVEYVQANRVRTLLMREMARMTDSVDLYVAPTFGGDNLLLTNLTGHPCVVLPNGMTERRTPASITFVGGLFREDIMLAAADCYQRATSFHLRRPPVAD